ncbi:4174_t:CDS:2, partial [Scutellospora calospora]
MGKRKSKQEMDEEKDNVPSLYSFSNEDGIIENKAHENISTRDEKISENTINNEIKQTVEKDGGKESSEAEKHPKKRKRIITKEIKDEVDSKIQSQSKNLKSKDNIKSTANKMTKKALEPKKQQKKIQKSSTKVTESLSEEQSDMPIMIDDFKTMVSTAKGRWTIEDDKLLSNLVLAHLPEIRWSNISRENFPERNRSSLYNRWNVIKKRLWNGSAEPKGE